MHISAAPVKAISRYSFEVIDWLDCVSSGCTLISPMLLQHLTINSAEILSRLDVYLRRFQAYGIVSVHCPFHACHRDALLAGAASQSVFMLIPAILGSLSSRCLSLGYLFAQRCSWYCKSYGTHRDSLVNGCLLASPSSSSSSSTGISSFLH